MPADFEVPNWARDAVENPVDMEDQYEIFDPEYSTPVVETAVIAKNKKPKKTVEEQSRQRVTEFVKAYNAGKQVVDSVELEPYTLPSHQVSRYRPSDVAQFLFGDELKSLGISLDENETRSRTEIAYQQWSEHPIRTSIAWASWLAPGLGKLYKTRKAAELLAKVPDSALAASGKFASEAAFAAADDATKTLARKQILHESNYMDLLNKAQNAPDQLTMMERVKLRFNQNFATSYAKLSDPSSSIVHNIEHKTRMQNIIKEEIVDPFLKDIPEELMDADDLGRYLMGTKPLTSFSAEAQGYVTAYESKLKDLQRRAFESGMIDQATYDRIGDIYVPMLPKQYQRHQRGFQDSLLLMRAKRPVEVRTARLESDAFKQRHTGLDDFAEMIDRGDAFGDPRTLTVQGMMEQEMLLMNHEYIRDIAMHPRFSATLGQLRERGEDMSGWVSLDVIPGSHRIRRMMGKKNPALEAEDRYLSFETFHEIFGGSGMISQSGDAIRFFENLTRIHKFSKTGLNLFTHGQNIMGNIAFLSQAGFRLLGGKGSTANWKAVQASMANINRHYKVSTGKMAEEMLEFKPITVGGKTFTPTQVADELSHPACKDIIEESTFLNVEASNGDFFEKLADKAADINDYMARAARSGQNWMKTSARFYNVEDAGPKFAYYLHNRARGLSEQAAAIEVARRLPIYHALAAGPRVLGQRVGPASLRKWMFPWISFPAEALRITKNNLQDYPLRMAAWLHTPQILQSFVHSGSHALGVGEPMTYEDYNGIRRQLPIHAQRPGAVTLPFKDKNDDFRSIMLDFIPHFSFMPKTTAPEAAMRQISPVDIAPIWSGILGMMTGRDINGNEIRATSKADIAGKFVANGIGFLTPPYVQKYFFGITSPREQPFAANTYRLEQDLGMVINPATGKSGSWLADLVVNNTVMRNYASSPEQELWNKELDKSRHVEKVRNELGRRFMAAVRSGSENRATENLVQVYNTFEKEFTPGPMAQKKFVEWLVRRRKDLVKHPQLRRYSKEEILTMLLQNLEQSAETSSVAMDGIIRALKQELIARQMQR